MQQEVSQIGAMKNNCRTFFQINTVKFRKPVTILSSPKVVTVRQGRKDKQECSRITLMYKT